MAGDLRRYQWTTTGMHSGAKFGSMHYYRGLDADSLIAEQEAEIERLRESPRWRPIASLRIDDGPVLLYSPKWVDPDFNPRGIREGFRHEDEDGQIYSAAWNGVLDWWVAALGRAATHWMPQPTPPEMEKGDE